MKIEIIQLNGIKITEVISEDILIKNTQDALDLMVNSINLGSRKIIIKEKNIIPAFFDLKTGVAGEILQKFSNYDVQLAIVGDFSKYTSKSLRDFIIYFDSSKLCTLVQDL